MGLDDKFGGGNVITETLAAAVVTLAMPQNIASCSKLHPSGGGGGGGGGSACCVQILTDGEVIYEGNI